MLRRVSDDFWLYAWSRKWPWPEDRQVGRDKVNSSEHAFKWIKSWPEDKDIMKKVITEPRWALMWIKNIGLDLDMLEICKKDKGTYQEALEFVLQGSREL